LADHMRIVLPCIAAARRAAVALILDNLSEIIWISYTEPAAQKLRGLRLRLHVLTFIFANQFEQLYGTNIKDGLLFLHKIISHYGPFFELSDFRNCSTEPGM